MFVVVLGMSNGTSTYAATATDAQYLQIQKLLLILQSLRIQLAEMQKITAPVSIQQNLSIYAQLEIAVSGINKAGPIMIDPLTRLNSATASVDNKIVYHYTLLNNKSASANQSLLESTYPSKLVHYCENPFIEWYRVNDVPMVWSYYSTNNIFLSSFEANNQKCTEDVVLDSQMMEKNLLVTTGRASLRAEYVLPFKIKVTATYNIIKDCRAGVIYNITYSDNQEPDSVTTDGSCTQQTVTKYHTFEPMQKNYSVGIEMYAVRNNAWTHFVQAAKLVRINADGSMTIESNNPSTWKKG